MYNDQRYLENHPNWHMEDSPWKARQLYKMIERNTQISFERACEVGCGAGEILHQLSSNYFPNVKFVGFDVSPDVAPFWNERRSDRLEYRQADFTVTEDYFDLALYVDVVEHIENSDDFLRKVVDKSTYKIFCFPLELFVFKVLFKNALLASRRDFGHLHFYNEELCLQQLKDAGYEILDVMFAGSSIDLASVSQSISAISKLVRIPRIILSWISVRWTARILGGYSLIVLAK